MREVSKQICKDLTLSSEIVSGRIKINTREYVTDFD